MAILSSAPWNQDAIAGENETADRFVAPSTTAYVLTRLRADILAAHFMPGTKLPLKILIERYKTSVVPIREALAVLCGVGLVVSESQRGYRVASACEADFIDVADMRKRLETLALRMSIERGDDVWENNIKTALADLSRVSQKVGEEGPINNEWEHLHRQFHFTLIACCSSPSLISFCYQLYERYDRYRRIVLPSKSHMAGVAADNDEIIAAVLSRDLDRAETVLGLHIQAMTDILLEMIRTKPGIFSDRPPLPNR